VRASLKQNLIRQVIRLSKTLFGPPVPLRMQRAFIENAARANPLPRGARVSKLTIRGVPCERVEADDGTGRAVLYLHGGAFCIGSPRTHRSLAAHFAKAARATLYVPDYRLAPEHPFPAPLEDAVHAWRGLLELGFDPSKLAIAGDSAGGALTILTAVALRDRGLPLPARLAVISPWTDYAMSGPSHRANVDIDPMLRRAWLEQALGWHRPQGSPLDADLAGLPPLHIQVGSDEILLSDAELLADRARAAGVQVSLRRFEGLWHVFQVHAGTLPISDEAVAELAAFVV
jgi:epsilon-lactone hydrolase